MWIEYWQLSKPNFYSKCTQNYWLRLVYFLLTVWSLICQDIKQMFSQPQQDYIFDIISTVCVVFFIFDIILQCVYVHKYYKSLLIFFDIIGVISIVITYSLLYELLNSRVILSIYGLLARGARCIYLFSLFEEQINAFLVAMLNIIGQKQSLFRRYKETMKQNELAMNQKQQIDFLIRNSLVKIEHKTTDIKRILVNDQLESISDWVLQQFQLMLVLVTLLIVIIVPIFRVTSYTTDIKIEETGLQYILYVYSNPQLQEILQMVWDQYMINMQTNRVYQLVYLQLYQQINSQSTIVKEYINYDTINTQYWSYEVRNYQYTTQNQAMSIRVKVQWRDYLIYDSRMNMLRTLLIMLIYIIFSFIFRYDFLSMFGQYFQSMISLVKNLQKNHLKVSWTFLKRQVSLLDKEINLDEIKYIQKTLCLSLNLLKTGVGLAGERLISQNLINNNLQPIIQGEKIYGLFCFIIVDDFNEKINQYQKQFFTYINLISKIVHEQINQFDGNINRNLGEAYLILWKVQKDGQHNYYVFERAIYSCVQILFQIKTDNNKTYLINEQRLQIGLHYGWAIEGTIGSNHKIDVSYLSPNVNIASRVASICKFYSKQILFSETVYDLLREHIKQQFWIVDWVQLKGSKLPQRLYTYDFNIDVQLQLTPVWRFQSFIQQKSMKSFSINELDMLWQLPLLINSWQKYIKNNYQFFQQWNEFFDIYQRGYWSRLLDDEFIKQRFSLLLQDTVYENILQFIKELEYFCPPQWKGVRKLNNKG